MDEFVDLVLMGLSYEESDADIIRKGIEVLGKRGFSIGDAIAFAQCWEEVDPSMDEDTALRRMAEIQKKYPPTLE
jgi:hypothetical protein